jgi:hypothetical protein
MLLMRGFWMLGSTGALFTHVWNAVSEAQPSSLDRLGRSIGATNERHSAVASCEARRILVNVAKLPELVKRPQY